MDYARFFQEGLFFGPGDARKLSDLLTKASVGCGLALGTALATAAARDVGRTGGDGPYGPIAVAAGFVVGAAAGTLGCMSVKSKILGFLSRFQDETAAIGALTPALRSDLRNEAFAMLKLSPETHEPAREYIT